MALGASFGRLLFVVFLLVRGAQHIHKPDDWTSNFVKHYDSWFDVTSKISYVNNFIPGHVLDILSPKYISIFAHQYGKYIGYTELLTAAAIFLNIPLLPLLSATLLLIETLIFFNPFKANIGKELYYLIIYTGIVGIVYMMAFAPPIFKIRRNRPQAEASRHVPTQSKGREQQTSQKGGERSGSNKGRRRE